MTDTTTPRTLQVTVEDGCVVVTLSRPGQRNAIDKAMVTELGAVLTELERGNRILILTGGQDGTFAAGADIAELLRRGRDEALQAINLGLFERLRRTPMPTIAAVDGVALGGGAELAYACDLRIATPRAQFGQPEVRLGIMAGAGGCYRLATLVGETLAKDMLFTGRRLDASEALASGLVSRVVEPDALLSTAQEMARTILKGSPLALRMSKLAIDSPAAAHPTVDVLGQALLFDDEEKANRMSSFLQRREPLGPADRAT